MYLMHTLFGLKSSSDRLSSHIGNLYYLENKYMFLIPLFCAAKVSVILEWCFISEASTIRSVVFGQHFTLSLHFTSGLQSAF